MREMSPIFSANCLFLLFLVFSQPFLHPAEASTEKVAGGNIISGSLLGDTDLPQMQWISIGSSSCSATLVGPRVIVTAAHCAKRTSFTFGETYRRSGTLYTDPNYTAASDIPAGFALRDDLAIGILNEPITDITPISISSRLPRINEYLLFAGVGAPTLGIRQYGYANVIIINDMGITVRGIENHLQIGAPGDSGGPVFIRNSNQSLEVIAVNSTSTRTNDWRSTMNWQDALPYTMGTSRIMRNSKVPFIRNFAAQHQVQICGINVQCPPVFFNPH